MKLMCVSRSAMCSCLVRLMTPRRRTLCCSGVSGWSTAMPACA